MDAQSTKFDPQAAGIDPVVADRNKVLMLVFLFALAIRLVHLLALYNSPIFEYLIGDAAKYSKWGSEIAAGN